MFGDGRVYIGTTKGFLYGFGSPVNLPINCTSPVDFGTANLNTPTASKTITCKANVGVTISNVSYVGDSNFVVSGLPTVPSTYAAGATFTMTAVFNPKAVGILSQDILITTSNGVAGYSTSTPITLRGTGQSVDALLRISPVTLAFEGVIAGGQVGGVNQSAIFTNLGNAALSISDIQYSIVGETGPFVAPNGTAANPKAGPFTFYGLPETIPGNSGVSLLPSRESLLGDKSVVSTNLPSSPIWEMQLSPFLISNTRLLARLVRSLRPTVQLPIPKPGPSLSMAFQKQSLAILA